MTAERTETGREIEAALGEVLADRRGETVLARRIVDDPTAGKTESEATPAPVPPPSSARWRS